MITKSSIFSWLQQHHVATIATISKTYKPELAVVYTNVGEDFNCYFITKESTRKYKNLQRDKTITLAWFNNLDLTMCEMAGEAFVVQDLAEASAAMVQLEDLMVNQQAEYWTPPVGQLEGSQYAIFRVIPRRVSFTEYSAATTLSPEPEKLEFLP
jgi:uncharacterized pyridoxamine 5'-phosphate oxidase family protein